jgi:protoporphyrinogen oxidase
MTEVGEHWGIVGGGMLGLMIAHRLSQHRQRVTLLESSPYLGGLAASWRIGNIAWDKHYHGILMSDSKVRELLKGIGLASELEFVETKTGFYTDGKLYSMSNSLEFLKFPPLQLYDKFRLALTVLRAATIQDWKPLEKILATDWLRRWSGRRTLEKIWLPLLRAKLGDNYKIASAAFIWAIIARMYAARRSGMKKEMFGYVHGGYATIIQRFAEYLRDNDVGIFLRQRAEKITSNVEGVHIELEDDRIVTFDRVVVTAAAPLASKLCPGLTPQEHQRLKEVPYQGIICASLLLKQSLSPYYITNITETWVPFTAVIEMSALVDREQFAGNALVYLPKYADPNDPLFDESDHSIQERFLSALEKMYPHFRREDVLAFRVSRVKHVFAVSTLDYSEKIPPILTSQQGLYLVNSSQIVHGTFNVNETLQLADRAVPELLQAPKPIRLSTVGADE